MLRGLALAAACVLAALAAGRTARALVAELPAAAAIAAFAAFYGVVRALLASYSTGAREGWLGALPVARAVRERSAAALALVLGAAFGLGLFVAAVAAGGRAAAIPFAPTLAIGLAAGLAAWAATRSMRSPRARTTRRGPASRARIAPRLAFGPAWPRSDTMPHLALWQRVRTASRWRSAGRAWQFGLLALALPRNTAVLHGVVFVATVGVASWWLTMVAASLDAYREARALLAALAHDRRVLAGAALRYPVLATGGAVALLALAYTLAWWQA